MTHGTWQIAYQDFMQERVKVRILYCKKNKNEVFFFVSCTWEPEYINEHGSASKFPSTGHGSQVRVNYKQLQYIKVPEYGLKFPSTGQGSRVRILEK